MLYSSFVLFFLRRVRHIEVFVDNIGMAVNQLLTPSEYDALARELLDGRSGETREKSKGENLSKGGFVALLLRLSWGFVARLLRLSWFPPSWVPVAGGPWVVVRLFLLSWCLSLVPRSLSHFLFSLLFGTRLGESAGASACGLRPSSRGEKSSAGASTCS